METLTQDALSPAEQVAQAPAPPAKPPAPSPLTRALAKGPVLLWRLGLGRLLDRWLMIMTTTGRKSGLPRRTAIQFFTYHGRRYVYGAHGAQADWYRNIQ